MGRRKRFTLMPAIAVAALGLMVALPTLSSVRLYAATARHYNTVTVRPGDTLWGIAAAHSAPTSTWKRSSMDQRRQPFESERSNPVNAFESRSRRHRTKGGRLPEHRAALSVSKSRI